MIRSPAARTALCLVALAAIATMGSASERRERGYLDPGEVDVTAIIQPAPRKGDPRYEMDRRIFRATRPMLATERGRLAVADVDDTPDALMRDFSCAVGVRLTPANAPRLLHLALRAGADTGAQNSLAKSLFRRQRPFHIDKGAVCESREALGNSFDYPSGHVTRGWTWAYVLTDAAPDRAQRILTRGRAFGESRFICGAHNESAVEAGGISASATMAVVRTKPAYQQDLADARAELAALRASPAAEAPAGCDAEERLVSRPVLGVAPPGGGSR